MTPSPAPEPGIARLCATCRRAVFHDAFDPKDDLAAEYLDPNDDRHHFEERLNADGSPCLGYPSDRNRRSNFRVLWSDHLPDLPRLYQSSSNGCDFCYFLRSIVLSADTDDAALRTFGKRLKDMGTREVTIFMKYHWQVDSETFFDSQTVRHIDQGEYSDEEEESSGEEHEEKPEKEEISDEREDLDESGDREELDEGEKTGIREDGNNDNEWWARMHSLVVRLEFGGMDQQLSLVCPARGVSGADETAKWLGLEAPSSQSYTEAHRIEWMIQQLEHCSEHHRHEQTDGSFTPMRLINVQEPIARLVDRSEYQGSRPRYAALSYCWGSPEDAKLQLTTTMASVAQRQTAIHAHEMTDVLRDAIFMTRALSIPYLWVDSLCILQDDISDWEQQCVDMAKVYENAYVTLSAASSMSCLEGFLQQRGFRVRMPFRSIRRPTISGLYDLQFKWALCSSSHLSIDDAVEDLTSCRWGNRGWVFQEAYSSTCRLAFGNSNVHYLCGGSKTTMGGMTVNNWDSKISRRPGANQDTLFENWRSLVEDYSRFDTNSFTKVSDILPALSGLAAQFHKCLQSDFVAGLWRRDLLFGLMWSTHQGHRPDYETYLSRPLPTHGSYLLPSWGPVGNRVGSWPENWGYLYANFRPETEILDAETVLAGKNVFGPIKDGWLRIRSSILDLASLSRLDFAIAYWERGPFDSVLLYRETPIGEFALDFAYSPYTYEEGHLGEELRILDDIASFKWVLLGSCSVKQRDDCEHAWLSRPERGAFGLILYPVPNSEKFHRVGVFYPAPLERHGDGLRLFRTVGEIKDVVVI